MEVETSCALCWQLRSDEFKVDEDADPVLDFDLAHNHEDAAHAQKQSPPRMPRRREMSPYKVTGAIVSEVEETRDEEEVLVEQMKAAVSENMCKGPQEGEGEKGCNCIVAGTEGACR